MYTSHVSSLSSPLVVFGRGALVVGLTVLAGCADVPTTEEQGNQHLLGTTSTTSCTTNEQALALHAVSAGRFVAVSDAFRQCVATAMAGRTRVLRFGGATDVGPYAPSAGDPFARETLNIQVERAAYASTSTNDVSLTCGSRGDNAFAEAYVGSWNTNRQSPEALTAAQLWRNLAGVYTNRSATQADFFQSPVAQAANAIWHEVMHQWGYRHDGSDAQMMRSVPYIVGGCMEQVMRDSSTCAVTCGASQRPLRWGAGACTCVDDPQYDVGVVLDAGESCPTPAGRASARTLDLFMDDEDDNTNRRSGWIGQTVSTWDTMFRFCVVPGAQFRRAYTTGSATDATYAVARMGASCPPGSVAFARYFDNEDSSNRNYSVGHVPPHLSSTNTRVELCMFPAVQTSFQWAPFPSIGRRYGVFAPRNMPGALAVGEVYIDGEDSDPASFVSGASNGSEGFLTASGNTTLRLARMR